MPHSAGPTSSPRKWRQFRRSQPPRDGEIKLGKRQARRGGAKRGGDEEGREEEGGGKEGRTETTVLYSKRVPNAGGLGIISESRGARARRQKPRPSQCLAGRKRPAAGQETARRGLLRARDDSEDRAPAGSALRAMMAPAKRPSRRIGRTKEPARPASASALDRTLARGKTPSASLERSAEASVAGLAAKL